VKYIGLDVGSSSVKGAVLKLDPPSVGDVIRADFPAAAPGLPPRRYEVEPGEILAAVRGVLESLAPAATDAQGLFLCGQMGGLILTDASGRALSRYVSWMDSRLVEPGADGVTEFEELERHISADVRRELGNEVRPGLTFSYLYWLARRGELPPGATAASLPEFVAGSLCGAAPAGHACCSPGAIHLGTLDWHRDAARELGFGDVAWPRLLEALEPAGTACVAGRELPCYPGFGDHPCALLGAGIEEGELSINVSTGSQASIVAPRHEPGPYQTRPFFDGKLLNTVTHIPAGRALNVLVRLVTEMAGTRAAGELSGADPWPYILAEAARAEARGSDLETRLTFFPGPLGDRGAISGIHEGNLTVGDLFLAAFRDMARSYDICASRLCPDRSWRRVVFSGGLVARAPLLRREIEQKLGSPARLATVEEDTLTGLLAIALAAAQGAPTVLEAARQIRLREAGAGGAP